MRTSLALIAALTLSAASFGAQAAAPCRDTKGKFVKCSTTAAPVRCRDAKGHFAKCGSPGAHPAK